MSSQKGDDCGEPCNNAMLKRSIELIVSHHSEDEMMNILEAQWKVELAEFKTRCEMVVEGFASLQAGKSPDGMREVFREYR